MVVAVVEPAAILSWLAPRSGQPGVAAPEVGPVISEAALLSANDTGVPDLLAVRAVIEQAKGVLMATYRCGPDVASDLLNKASQCLGVKVHVLAARVVALAARGTELRLPGI